jgi:transcription initiation factor TFIIIB Brf1 subunit/transcription initiation factor TFIIB
MTNPTCPHKRTQLIAKDNEAHYVECLDCGEILEAGELDQRQNQEAEDAKKKAAGFDESLSDA